jgi:hypothetical protein
MGFFVRYDASYFTGGAVATSAGRTKFDVSIAGRGYLIDTLNQQDGFKFESIPLLKRYFLQDAALIGETELNPDDYWRRSFESWHSGGGQVYNDNDSISTRTRFHLSKGVDPWTAAQLTLLNGTAQRVTSTNTNLAVVVAGADAYLLDGNTLKYTADLTGTPSLTTVTADGTTAALSSPTSVTSDGYTVWVCDPTRVNFTLRATGTFGKYHTTDHVATLIRTTKGRLFTAYTNILYVHAGAAGSSVATAYYTHPNVDWTWVDITGGPDAIYFAGFSGDKSQVYRATIKADGTALDVPIASLSLPTGEIVRSLTNYQGLLFVGTDKGVRIAQMASDGSLSEGDLIPVPPVYSFASSGRFVWFGWTNYDTTSTGLGRLDLSTFNGTTPAYASDLMATDQGQVTSVATFQNARVFAVSGKGFYAETLGTKVASGTLTSGTVAYAMSSPKRAIKVDTQYAAGVGSFTVALACDGSTPQQMGGTTTTGTVGGDVKLPAGTTDVGRTLELTLTITAKADLTQAPVITRMTLLADPMPDRRFLITAPLLLHTNVTLRNGQRHVYNPPFERSQLIGLYESRQVVPFQDGDVTYATVLEDFKWVPDVHLDQQIDRWDGTFVTTWKAVI